MTKWIVKLVEKEINRGNYVENIVLFTGRSKGRQLNHRKSLMLYRSLTDIQRQKSEKNQIITLKCKDKHE